MITDLQLKVLYNEVCKNGNAFSMSTANEGINKRKNVNVLFLWQYSSKPIASRQAVVFLFCFVLFFLPVCLFFF